jgi:molybdopterin molybdotransferase
MADDSSIQRISRLTPLKAVLALIGARVAPVKPRRCDAASAEGLTLADDIVTAARPVSPIALRDGFAVEASAVSDASPYAPALLASLPQWIHTGGPLPAGTDTVAPLDAITQRGDRVEAIAPVAPGEGVLPAGGDFSEQAVLRRAGERLRDLDCAVARVVGFADLSVREPRIWIANGSAERTPLIDAGLAMLVRFVAGSGASTHGELSKLHEALARDEADGVIAIGGTGSGRDDSSVQHLARLGRVEVHGIAVSPGETAAFGFVGERPVLLIPGRLDAALAVWLLIGRYIVARLAGGKVVDSPVVMPLKRKATSAIGLAELVPVARSADFAEPLASGYLSLSALTGSDGWFVVPAESEGFPAGTEVAVHPWP